MQKAFFSASHVSWEECIRAATDAMRVVISLPEMMMMVMVDRSHAINARERTNALGSPIEVAASQ